MVNYILIDLGNLLTIITNMNREIILDLMGWRKNAHISMEEYDRGYTNINICPPLNAMLPREEIPEITTYTEVRFVKYGFNEKGMAIFKF